MPECHSTNDLAAQIVRQPSTNEGTVVITDKQTMGRGQRGNYWRTEPGKNLTFSVVLKPAFVEPKNQFLLTMVISLAVHDLIQSGLNCAAFIKWPNDIMIERKKVCGILIENQLKGNEITHSIAGIGLNVNQKHFEFPSATSLAQVLNKQFYLPSLVDDLLENIEARYLMLRSGKFTELKAAYVSVLYWKGEPHTFSIQGLTLKGIISGVDAAGKLLIDFGERERAFDIKEVEYLE
ncbi:MAG TPA: biotin--[acetyl-CoA-carboxylase] ligase [Cyclobacteriaceae bacterium]|nr:biotin--[acetyl-CoA-carboxylase] ligase [Cyclobacteriaceae bacterium]